MMACSTLLCVEEMAFPHVEMYLGNVKSEKKIFVVSDRDILAVPVDVIVIPNVLQNRENENGPITD